ncbi:hypothetical protein EDB87DRAFT_1821506, partial [Lactarius vividus]
MRQNTNVGTRPWCWGSVGLIALLLQWAGTDLGVSFCVARLTAMVAWELQLISHWDLPFFVFLTQLYILLSLCYLRYKLTVTNTMSPSTSGQTPTPSSDLKAILDSALSEYKRETGKQLLDHPLAAELQRCDSVDAVLAIFQGQAEAFQQFRDGDQRLMKWISPVVDVLFTFSGTLSEIAGVAFPPAGPVFTGISVLLAAAKDVSASHDALAELFERIENFFKRLGVYTRTSMTAEMREVFVKIMSEVLCILSIATKEVKRKRAKIYFRRLLGRTDIEDALKRLDSLIQEEVRMAIAQITKVTIEHKHDSKKANV